MMSEQRADEILEFIREYIQRELMAPSVREICDGLGIRSTSTVHRYLHRLEKEGRIHMATGKNRAIIITDNSADDAAIKGIPLVRTVAADIPIAVEENIIGYVDFKLSGSYIGQLFALRICGEGMINAGILDGDIVIVEQTSAAENGDFVVVQLDGSEVAVRTIYQEEGHYRLQPENDDMPPIIVDDVEILGKVVSMIRYF